jgi:hypothetical protein
MPNGNQGSFQDQPDDTQVESPSKNWGEKAINSAKLMLRATGKSFKLAVIGLILLFMVTAGLILAIVLGIAGGGDLRSGTSASQPADDNDKIIQILTLAGDRDALRQEIIKGSPQINRWLDEIDDDLNKLTDDKRNQPAVQAVIKKIRETKSLINQASGSPSPQSTSQIVQNLKEIGSQSSAILAPSGADFKDIRDAEIAKIRVVKSCRDKSKRRIYFLDADDNTLGSAPIEVGANCKKRSNFREGDKATPTGNFKVYSKEHAGKMFYSTIYKAIPLGYHKIRITGGPRYPRAKGKGTKSILERGIIIHGSAENRQDRLSPTAGCIRMYNRHLAYIFPLIKKGIPLEIVE